MHNRPVYLTTALCLLISGVFIAGCSSTVPPQETGSVQLNSTPPGAEIYLDHEYRGTTPAIITAIPAGNHTVEIRRPGYDSWSAPVTVRAGSPATISAMLTSIPTTLPVIFATAGTPVAKNNIPQIHIDGYWTWPQGVSGSTTNPVSLLVHTNGFNVGYTDAREVTVSANLYYEGRQVCWNTVYLGTLKAGSHVMKETMVSCTLPSGLNSPDLNIRFENVVVTP
jgi:hypothetical protein